MKKIICHTKFKLDSFGDGGSRRSMQIRDLLAKNGFAFEDDDFVLPKETTKRQLVRWTIRAMKFIRRHYPKRRIKSLSDYIRMVKYYALRLPSVYDKYVQQDVVFLWENTTDCDMLYLLKATGRKVFAMPHNIESLVFDHSIDALTKEVAGLKLCDGVFAISKEETWLLRLLGVKAYYLPYFPPKEVEAHLLMIRNRREHRRTNERKKYLLLGSASNYPTRKGMQMLLDAAASHPLPFDLSIAGYRTNALRVPQQAGITFYGTVTNKVLDGILEETDAVLIFQPPTTGALTRIPEMLLAGIPVFVNFDAGRNCLDLSDVHLYDSFEGLFEALENFVPYQTEPIKWDALSENKFATIIKHL